VRGVLVVSERVEISAVCEIPNDCACLVFGREPGAGGCPYCDTPGAARVACASPRVQAWICRACGGRWWISVPCGGRPLS
jgi:hypothetical protein